jgi:hypothetical protein
MHTPCWAASPRPSTRFNDAARALDAAASGGDFALLAQADALAPQVAQLLDETDRFDAAQARRSITAATGTEWSSRP